MSVYVVEVVALVANLYWPLKPQSPYKGTPDGSLLVEYQNVLDHLDVLIYVAANTNNIVLGISIIDMFYYTLIMLVKRCATLDVLSQGRTNCGLAIGFSKDEYQASNIPFGHRGS